MKSESELLLRVRAATAALSPSLRMDAERSVHEVALFGVTTVTQLENLLRDLRADPSVLTAACHVASRINDSRLAGPVCDVLCRAAEAEVVWEAAKALGALKQPESLERILPCLGPDESETRQSAAAWTMGVTRYRNAVSGLIGLLKNVDVSNRARAHAAEALGIIGAVEATDSLVAALGDPSPDVRYWSVYALGTLRTVGALAEIDRIAGLDDGITESGLRVADEARWAASQIRG